MKYKKLNFIYDKDKLIEEVFQHEKEFIEIPATKEFLQYRPFDIVDPAWYDQVTTVSNLGINKGTIPSWSGYSFTHVPGDKMSFYGGNALRLKYEEWVWRNDANCPYLKSIVDTLGFTQIQNIRSMVLQPPGFGPVHCDAPPSHDYYNTHVSITLNLEDGGMPLIALIDGQYVECNDTCFIFEDNCWHGVGQVTSRRTQLRINGKVNQGKLNEYLS
jgi:hypothetical protein